MKRKERKPSFGLSSGKRKDVIKVFFIFPNSLLTSAAPLSRASNLHTRQITKKLDIRNWFQQLFDLLKLSRVKTEREPDWLEVGTCFFPLISRRSLFHSTYERGNAENLLLSLFLFSSASPPPPNQCWLQPPQGWKKRKRDRLIYKLHSSSTCVVFFPSCLLLLAFPPLESDNGHIIRRGNRQHSIFGMIQTMLTFFRKTAHECQN